MAAPHKRRNDAKLQRFEQELAKGRGAVEAAKLAGYTGSSLASNAKRRAQLPSVKAHVVELRREAAKNTVVTIERLVDNAEEARLMAMALEEPSAANQLIQTIAKLSGLWRDRVEVRPGILDELPTDTVFRVREQLVIARTRYLDSGSR